MYLSISNSGDHPIYEQITSQIKQAIVSGELTENQALPSLRYLAKQLRVSVISTKRAYEELEREGYIVSVPGKGSFVAHRNTELIREEQLKAVEGYLSQAIEAARPAGIGLEELTELMSVLYQETI